MGFDPQNLYGVVLAGGFGTRLWPLSRRDRPKQLIDLLGGGRSLVQQAVDRVAELIPPDRILVVTAERFAAEIAAQLPDVPLGNILVEPCPRNTAPAMGVAARVVSARCPDAVVVTIPSDHYVGDAERLRAALLAAAEAGYDHPVVSVLGVRPRCASTGLGYIEVGRDRIDVGDQTLFEVARFTEKPDAATAHGFLEGGRHLWNANYYTFHVDTFLASLAEYAPDLFRALDPLGEAPDAATIATVYAQVEAAPIDTAMTEKAANIYVLPTDMTWSDVGNWNELYEVLADGWADPDGTVVVSPRPELVIGIDTNDNLVLQATRRPIALVGVRDSVVVDLDDGLLIAARGQIQDIRRVVERLGEVDAAFT
ncbi:sugar phosphate nucleotidyltransferase [Actinomycetes bacterium KLBMP 9797]